MGGIGAGVREPAARDDSACRARNQESIELRGAYQVIAGYRDTRSEGPFPQHSTHRNSIQKSVYCWVVVRKFLDGSI
jgi:hypothetical protein